MPSEIEYITGRDAIASEAKKLLKQHGFTDEQLAHYNVDEKMVAFPDNAAEHIRIKRNRLEKITQSCAEDALSRLEKDRAYFTAHPEHATLATASNAHDFLARMHPFVTLPGESIAGFLAKGEEHNPAYSQLRQEIDHHIQGYFFSGDKPGAISELTHKYDGIRRNHVNAQEAVNEATHGGKTRWAPFIFTDTKAHQFQVWAQPYDFTPDKTHWAREFASDAHQFDARGSHYANNAADQARPNWVMFKDGEHTVVGVACRNKLLSETKYTDGAERPVTGFFGFVAKGPVNEIPRRDLESFRKLYDRVMTDELFFAEQHASDIALIEGNKWRGYDLAPPTEAIDRSTGATVNRNPNAILVAGEAESEKLWHAAAATKGNQSIILDTNFFDDHGDFHVSPFQNITSSPLPKGTHDCAGARAQHASKAVGSLWTDEKFCRKIGVEPLPKPQKQTSEQTESHAKGIVDEAEAVKAERNWVSKLFRNAEGDIHAGKTAFVASAGIALVGAGIYAVSHGKKEEDRRTDASSLRQ